MLGFDILGVYIVLKFGLLFFLLLGDVLDKCCSVTLFDAVIMPLLLSIDSSFVGALFGGGALLGDPARLSIDKA